MTRYIDFEEYSDAKIDGTAFDLLIVGSGVAGRTIDRELSGQDLRLLIVESGGLEETPGHEALNAVAVQDNIGREELDYRPDGSRSEQMNFRSPNNHRYDVRCHVFGGFAMARAAEMAQFDAVDLSHREWVPHSGGPLGWDALTHYTARAGRRLDVGPLLTDHRFWMTLRPRVPAEIEALHSFSSCFWQIVPSTDDMTDALRLDDESRRESHQDVTVFFNATTSAIRREDGNVTGVEVVSSLSGKKHCFVSAEFVVLAAGTVENARLLLLSKDGTGAAVGNKHDVVGRYLMGQPSMSLGSFSRPSQSRAASTFGSFPLFAQHRAFMYSHGLSINPCVQEQQRLTNMAVYATVHLSPDDPIQALKRLEKWQGEQHAADLLTVSTSLLLTVSHIGRMLLERKKVPVRLRRCLIDLAALLNESSVARAYIAKGSARKIEQVTLDIVCEQPPLPQNRVTLSEHCDRLGLPIARVTWDAGEQLRHGILTLGSLLARELDVAGIDGFQLSPTVVAGNPAKIALPNVGHSSGTTRMGLDVASSVVDPTCQVHGVNGLCVAGTSVFSTSGHTNPTLMTMALSIRLTDQLRERLASRRLAELKSAFCASDNGPLVLVTGATGDLGTAIVEQLLAKGYRVRDQFHRKLPNEARVEWLRADFSKADLVDAHLDSLLTGVSAVIHLAASGPGTPAMHVTNEVNLERFVQACVRHGIKYFGHASSMSVYGSPTKRLVTESDPLINLDLPLEKQYLKAISRRPHHA
ncbi:GMC oxidoreductase [Paraburkholderia sp. CI3]|uniref:GMC oxidoreductase n=1 Tax=Paraburkholderia sp. CI3 TaxID=2991060 RepID=UPI003D23893A